MSELTETALVLTHEHTRPKPEGGYAKEPALLDTLRESVTVAATEAGQGGSDPTKRWPINGDALVILEGIEKIVNTCWPGNGDPAYVRTPLRIKLNTWVNHTTDPVSEAALLDLCRRWTKQIRELLEPTKRTPLKGAQCPVCKWDSYPVQNEDGEWVTRPVLVAYPELSPVRVECQYPECPATDDNPNVWEGPEVAKTFFVSGVVNGN